MQRARNDLAVKRRRLQRAERFVTGKKFVTPVAPQRDGDFAPRELAEQVSRQQRAVAVGLVEARENLGQQIPRARETERLGAVPRTDLPGHAIRERQLVVGGLVEADAEGPQLPGRKIFRRQGRDERRIDPAAQENAQGHVGHHAPAHRRAEQLPQLLAPLLRTPVMRRLGLVIPVTPHAQFPRCKVDRQGMAAGEFVRALGHGQRCGHIAVGEILAHGRRGQAARHVGMLEQRGQLGREDKQPARGRMVVVEGFFPEAIATREQALLVPVANDERPHAVEAVRHVFAPDGIARQQHLGVGMVRAEHPPRLFEFFAQLREIVDLAIEDDHQPAIGGLHRLRPARKVENAQPAVPQKNTAAGPESFRVGPAGDKAVRHAAQNRAVARADKSGYAAHRGSAGSWHRAGDCFFTTMHS